MRQKKLKGNPYLNKKDPYAFAMLGEELRKNGLCRRGYQLLLPYEKQYNQAEKGKIDPRTVFLSFFPGHDLICY